MCLSLWVRRVPDERHPLVHLDDLRIERRCATDVEIKDARARLVADQEKVFEAFGDEQCVSVTFAFQERVGSDRRR